MTWEQEVKTKGISLGQLRDKQDVLIRQLERKFGIGEAESELIRAVEEPARLARMGVDTDVPVKSPDEIRNYQTGATYEHRYPVATALPEPAQSL